MDTSDSSSPATDTSSISASEVLIGINERLIGLLNERDYDNPFFFAALSPTMRVNVNGKLGSGPEDFIYGYRLLADPSEVFHVEPINSSATIDETVGSAKVLMGLKNTGYAAGIQDSGVILTHWTLSDGHWICFSFEIIFGSPDIPYD